MGWSPQGLKSMAELRAFVCNGGKLEVTDLLKDPGVTYKPGKRELKTAAKLFNKATVETRSNMPILKAGKVTYLFTALSDLKNG